MTNRPPPYWVLVLICAAVMIGLLLVFAAGGPLALYGQPFD